jgi:hypothetical protein
MIKDKIEKLQYDDAYLVDNIVNKLNEVIEEINYLHSRIDKHWAYHRRSLKDKIIQNDDTAKESL